MVTVEAESALQTLQPSEQAPLHVEADCALRHASAIGSFTDLVVRITFASWPLKVARRRDSRLL